MTACAQQQPAAAPPPPPKVTVSQPINREVVEWEEYTGRLEAVESVEVRARVNGYLQSIHFKNGATVKQGDWPMRGSNARAKIWRGRRC